MKPKTTDDVIELLDASFASSALGAALERGLFWLLDDRPMDVGEVALELGVPPIRCGYWLQLLCDAGLLERSPDGFGPSEVARSSILNVYSRDSWALLAEEARERFPSLLDLSRRIGDTGPAPRSADSEPSSYVARMAESPERARRFTRMLYELHRPLAEALAAFLDLRGVDRLMDLGGGSGVVSLALVRRNPGLSAVVVDVENVCAAGREVVAESAVEDRVTYHPADILRDDLPTGFDAVLECDVNVYDLELFRRIREALNPGGRFIVVDQFAPAEGVAPPPRLHWAFEGSLTDPEFAFPTAERVRRDLERAGFRRARMRGLPSPAGPCARITEGTVVIEATR